MRWATKAELDKKIVAVEELHPSSNREGNPLRTLTKNKDKDNEVGACSSSRWARVFLCVPEFEPGGTDRVVAGLDP